MYKSNKKFTMQSFDKSKRSVPYLRPIDQRSDCYTIYVKNMNAIANETDIRHVFAEFGHIRLCKVIRDTDGVSKGYGFIVFELETSAMNAVKACNGRPMFGRSLSVHPKGEKQTTRSVDNPRTEFYVENLSDDYNTDTKLGRLFETFGDVTYTKVVTETAVDTNKVFAYVSHASSSVANTAIKILNGMPVRGGQRLRIERVLTREERRRTSNHWHVFVNNLNKDVDNHSLYEKFSQFGKMFSCRVAIDDRGYSKGYGFISFFHKPDADRAVDANGLMMMGRKLIIKHRHGKILDDIPENCRKIFVYNLSLDYNSEEKLRGLFSLCGDVTAAELHTDTKGKLTGLATVTFAGTAMADKACHLLNGFELPSGKRLIVWKNMCDSLWDMNNSVKEDYECQICFDKISEEKAVSYGCDHRFCLSCVRKFLEVKIMDGQVNNLQCPDRNCSFTADQTLIKRIVSKFAYETYDRILKKKAIENMDDVISCPTPNCNSIIEVNDYLLKAECHQCLVSYCSLCLTKFHPGKDCPLTDRQKREQKEQDERYVQKTFKKCPKCNHPIEKNGGCDHMTCECGHQFCWVCNQPWALQHLCIPIITID